VVEIVKVLALNAGSSSLKFALYESRSVAKLAATSTAGEFDGDVRQLARGAVEHIGSEDASFRARWATQERTEPFEAADHARAARRVIAFLRENGLISSADSIVTAHRIVHGGPRYVDPTIVDHNVMREISSLSSIAPLHNGPAHGALHASRQELGAHVRAIAIFDTAFFARLPDHSAQYPIPFELAKRHGIRRFGFHGLAHRWMAGRFAALRGNAAKELRVITLQLGSGCSAAAIRNGQPVDVSMGFSPLEGLMMSTRSGDIDPTLIAWLAQRENVSAAAVGDWLNTRSGLLGVSGISSDIRVLLRAASEGHEQAKLAVDMFCHRARKYVGAYLALLGGADAIVFGGGIGENLPEIRARVCGDLGWCGGAFDDITNSATVGIERQISGVGARTHVWVVPVDEELLIARDALRCLTSLASGGASGVSIPDQPAGPVAS
jgi:acetate kinase